MSLQISNWGDLRHFGINTLTGESCAYSMRILCDMNEDGIALIREFFGMEMPENPRVQFANKWNSTVEGKPALVSIMLSRGIFADLCRFALLRSGAPFIVQSPDGSWYAYSDEEVVSYGLTRESLQHTDDWRVYVNPTPKGAGSRNQHAFTGRTE